MRFVAIHTQLPEILDNIQDRFQYRYSVSPTKSVIQSWLGEKYQRQQGWPIANDDEQHLLPQVIFSIPVDRNWYRIVCQFHSVRERE